MKTLKRARCIAINRNDGRRCRRRAGRRSGDLFLCARHGILLWALADDRLRPAQRRLLAYASWRTFAEAQALIDKMADAR